MNNTITVTIHDTPLGPYVNREPVQMERTDEIEWIHADGKDFTVTFGKTQPFKRKTFKPSNPNSGKPIVHGNPKKAYKYSVKTLSGTIDPGVIVH